MDSKILTLIALLGERVVIIPETSRQQINQQLFTKYLILD